MFKEILGNVQGESEECPRRFRGMFEKFLKRSITIPENISKGSMEYYERFQGKLKTFLRNLPKVKTVAKRVLLFLPQV